MLWAVLIPYVAMLVSKAIYLALVASEDVLHVVRVILIQVTWQFFKDIGELVKNEDVTAHLFLSRRVEGANTGVL